MYDNVMQQYNELIAKCKVLGKSVPYTASYDEEYDALRINELKENLVYINIHKSIGVYLDNLVISDLKYHNKQLIFKHYTKIHCDTPTLMHLMAKGKIKITSRKDLKMYLNQFITYLYNHINNSNNIINVASLTSIRYINIIINNNFKLDCMQEIIDKSDVLTESFLSGDSYKESELTDIVDKLRNIIHNLGV